MSNILTSVTQNCIFAVNKINSEILTLNTILKELKDVPVDRLEELHVFINSLKSNGKKSDSRKKILSFGGSFNDMNSKDYDSFKKETVKIRTDLFRRDINL